MASLCLDPFDLVDIQLLASWSRWCILNRKLLQLLGEPPDFHNSAPHLSSRSTIVECHSARCDDIGPGAPSIIRSLLSLRATLPLCCLVSTLTFRFCCSNLASSVVSSMLALAYCFGLLSPSCAHCAMCGSRTAVPPASCHRANLSPTRVDVTKHRS